MLALAALAALVLAAAPVTAHDAGESDAHGDLRVSTDAADCSVTVNAGDVDHGTATFMIMNATEGTVLTKLMAPGRPQPDPGPARFSYGPEIHLTSDEAARADQVVMTFEDDGEHSATVFFEPFTCEDAAAPPTCPPVTDLRAEEDAENPDVRFTIHTVEGATAYRVYRATEGGAFELLEQIRPAGGRGDPDIVERISYVDESTEPGTTYTYKVTAINAAGESMGCEEHEVTTIPFFGAGVVMALAAVGSVGAYTVLRRRR